VSVAYVTTSVQWSAKQEQTVCFALREQLLEQATLGGHRVAGGAGGQHVVLQRQLHVPLQELPPVRVHQLAHVLRCAARSPCRANQGLHVCTTVFC